MIGKSMLWANVAKIFIHVFDLEVHWISSLLLCISYGITFIPCLFWNSCLYLHCSSDWLHRWLWKRSFFMQCCTIQ
jgi:hypothetical protein